MFRSPLNVFAEVSEYRNVLINVINCFRGITGSLPASRRGHMCPGADYQPSTETSKDAKQGSTKPYSTYSPSNAHKRSTTYANKSECIEV